MKLSSLFQHIFFSVIVTIFEKWDRYSHRDSYATTLCTLWADAFMMLSEKNNSEPAQLDAFEKGVNILVTHFGDWRVQYKNIVRHQRSEDNSYNIDPKKPSYPTDGNRGYFGTMLCMNSFEFNGKEITRRINSGNSYVAVIEFGEEVKAKSILNYGQSSHPDSPHYNDQAEMFANGR